MTAHLSRRSLLRAAPALAVPVTLTAPLPARASATDPLPGLYTQRKAAEAAWLAVSSTEGSPEEKAAWAEFRRLEDLIEVTVATSPEGVAAQLKYMKESYNSGVPDDDRPALHDVPFAFVDVVLEGLGRIGQ